MTLLSAKTLEPLGLLLLLGAPSPCEIWYLKVDKCLAVGGTLFDGSPSDKGKNMGRHRDQHRDISIYIDKIY